MLFWNVKLPLTRRVLRATQDDGLKKICAYPKPTRNCFSILFALMVSLPSLSFAAPPAEGPPPAFVEIAQVKSQPWEPQERAIGILKAIEGIMVRPEIAGRVTGIFFQSGTEVQQGSALFQFDPAILKAQFDAAKAQYELSEAAYQRATAIYKKHFLSKADLDITLATRNSNKANMQGAQAKLDQTFIRAPFAGRVGLNLVSLGEYVTEGHDLVNLQSVDPLRVDFSVPETVLPQLAIGETVTIRPKTLPNQTLIGKVIALDSAIDPTTHTLGLHASVPNKDRHLLPGAFVEVTLQLGSKKNVLMVPQTAIQYLGEATYVYKVVNNRAVKAMVQLGTQVNNDVIVEKGLSATDKIVTAGQIKIFFDGAPVIVTNKL